MSTGTTFLRLLFFNCSSNYCISFHISILVCDCFNASPLFDPLVIQLNTRSILSAGTGTVFFFFFSRRRNLQRELAPRARWEKKRLFVPSFNERVRHWSHISISGGGRGRVSPVDLKLYTGQISGFLKQQFQHVLITPMILRTSCNLRYLQVATKNAIKLQLQELYYNLKSGYLPLILQQVNYL